MKPSYLKFRVLLLPLLLLGTMLFSQGSYAPDSLIVHAKAVFDPENNRVLVRWVPHNYETWQWGLKYGYKLERTTIKIDDEDLPIGEIMERKTVLIDRALPVSESVWEELMESNEMAGVAASVIHGDSLEMIAYDQAGFMDVINQTQERDNRFSFALFAADNSFEVAEAMGLGFIDQEVDRYFTYVYTVKILEAPETTKAIRGVATVKIDETDDLPAPQNLVAIPGDHSALLMWESAGLGEHYTSYCVEFSINGGTKFYPAHDLPLIFGADKGVTPEVATFQDTLKNNETTYIYRVCGKTPFGQMGPYSDTVHVKGRPEPLAAQPTILGVSEVWGGAAMNVAWAFPATLLNSINGYDVYRSNKVDGEYVKINPTKINKTVFQYLDTNPGSVNYYKVKAEDKNGYTLESIAALGQLTDTIPPAAPTGLVGTSDKSGLVTLRWNKNTEADIMGYRVFSSNSNPGEFFQVTSQWVSDTVFKYRINLNTLSEQVFFSVMAIDFRENPSSLSAPCMVERPDIVPPAPPSISKVTAEPGKVHFEWEFSPSADAMDYKFQRKPNGAPGWQTLFQFNLLDQRIEGFTDSTASPRRYWDYRLLAIDEVGLVGPSTVIKAKPVDPGIRDQVTNFSGQLFGPALNQIVDLGWDFTHDPDLEGFEIFRAIDNNEMRSYKFLTRQQAMNSQSQSGANFGFLDYDTDYKNVPVQSSYSAVLTGSGTHVTGGTVTSNGNTYFVNPTNPNIPANPQSSTTVRYWIMAKYFDGATSPLSNSVTVVID